MNRQFRIALSTLAALALLAASPAPSPAETPDAEIVIPLAGQDGVAFPPIVETVPPIYPSKARADVAEGDVFVRALVLQDGSVGDALPMLATRPGEGFEAAAADAVRQWRFAPPSRNGEPTRVYAIVRVEFRMKNADLGDAVQRWKHHMDLGTDAMQIGAIQTAERELRRAVDDLAALDEKDLRRAETWEALGEVLLQAGERTEAKGLFERALALREEVQGPHDDDLSHALWRLSEIYDAEGRPADAKKLSTRARGLVQNP